MEILKVQASVAKKDIAITKKHLGISAISVFV